MQIPRVECESMKNSFLSSTVYAPTRSGSKAVTLRRIPIATRTGNDACGTHFDDVVGVSAAGRLPRDQPWDGVDLRGCTGNAGARWEGSVKSACPYRARPRNGHRQRDSGCGCTRHGTAAHGHPLLRSRPPDRPWNLLPGWTLAPTLG